MIKSWTVGLCGSALLVNGHVALAEIDLPDIEPPSSRTNAPHISVPQPASRLPPPPKPSEQAPSPNDRAVLQITVELADGSSILGQPKFESMPLQTSFAKVSIALNLLTSISFAEDHRQVTVKFQNGDSLQGVTDLKAIQMSTIFGDVNIPVDLIVRLTLHEGQDEISGKTFDGTNHIQIPGNGSFVYTKTNVRVERLPQPIRSCTWTFWMRTKQTTGAPIVSKAAPQNRSFFYSGVNDTYPNRPGKLTWVERTPHIDFKWATQKDVNDGEWHHIAIIRNFTDKTIAFYVDGKAEQAGRNPSMMEVSNDEPVLIGIDHSGQWRYEGQMRDVRFYPEALGEDEIFGAMRGRTGSRDFYWVDLGEKTSVPGSQAPHN